MPRRRRPYMPGAIFHLTARTQGQAHWFNAPMRDFICEAMAVVQQQTDAKLRAYSVMSNHLHVLLQQGTAPLAAFMQPLLCRTALAVKRMHKVDGHVFSRAFWDGLCVDETQLRTVIDYIHRNPVAAGLCPSPGDWRWSSHASYVDPHAPSCPIVEPVVDVASLSLQLHDDAMTPLTPAACSRVDLSNLLALALQKLTDGDLSMRELRCMRSSAATRVRRELIRRAAEAGYRGCLIARALSVSETTVSKVVRSERVCRPRL